MALIVYNRDFKKIAIINTAFNVEYNLKLNALYTARFTMYKNDPKNEFLQPFNFVELYDGKKRIELFRILPSTLKHSESTQTVEYELEHVLATLFDRVLFQYSQIGGLGVYTENVLRFILDKQTDWQLLECDFKHQFEYKFENENLLGALFSIPQPFTDKYIWKYNTTAKPWRISLKRLNNTTWKKDVLYKKNLVDIEKTTDPTNLATRIYPLGYGEGVNQLNIKKINNNKPYIEKNVNKYGLKETILVDRRFENAETLKEYAQKMLNELSEPYISYKLNFLDNGELKEGDNIFVRDDESNIKAVFPIVDIKRSLDDPLKSQVTIANKSQSIASSISELQNRARISETYSQGATNLLQLNFTDNADEDNPLKCRFYIPQEMARINKLLLRFELDNFRGYSKAIKGGGSQFATTEGGGYSRISSTTEDGDIRVDVGTTDVETYIPNGYGRGRGHNHGIASGTIFIDNRGEPREWNESGNHTHRVELDIRPHRHDIELRIPDHTHDIRLRDHTHEIQFGIYKGDRARTVRMKVDGGSTTSVNANSDINLIDYLSKDKDGRINRGQWHTVELIPDRLTRINANIVVQLFLNSKGGGDF